MEYIKQYGKSRRSIELMVGRVNFVDSSFLKTKKERTVFFCSRRSEKHLIYNFLNNVMRRFQ